MAVKKQFAIDRIARTLRREANEWKRKGVYYRWNFKGRTYFVLHDPEILERAKKCPDFKDDYELAEQDINAALKCNDWERQRNVALLIEVAKHVAAGHYNDQIIERLRTIAEIEKLYDAEAILASAPSRSVCGPVESWCMAALHTFGLSELHRMDSRREIIKSVGGSGV